MPAIYLSNWASHKTPGHHGPGRKLTIMAQPRQWEHGEGRVDALMPTPRALDMLHAGTMSLDQYRADYISRIHLASLAPGWLKTSRQDWHVADGDTLCCACSRAEAAAGRCHRVWAAHALRDAGWCVVLDGQPLAPSHDP